MSKVQVKRINSNDLLGYIQEEATKGYEERKGLLTDRVAALQNKLAFGAYVGMDMVGFAVLVEGTGHLDALHVAQGHRKRQVATTLLEELNVTGVMCERDNPAARALYQKLEFQPVCQLGDLEHFERDLL